jgi:Ni/Co efflux regulator RcnB
MELLMKKQKLLFLIISLAAVNFSFANNASEVTSKKDLKEQNTSKARTHRTIQHQHHHYKQNTKKKNSSSNI